MSEQQSEGTGEGNGAAAPKGRKVGAKAIIEQAYEDAREVIEQVAPTLIAGVEATEGSERASISLTLTYNPGGERSKARFEVTGKATISAKGFSHEMVIHEARSGEKQLKMFQVGA